MTITVAVDDVMKRWRVVGNGGHQVDQRLIFRQNPWFPENRSRVKNRGGDLNNKHTGYRYVKIQLFFDLS